MKSVILLGLYLLGIVLYFPLSHRVSYFSTRTFIDSYTPFVPAFVIPYLLLPVFLALALILLWGTPFRDQYLIALVIVEWSAVLFWFLFPTGVIRVLPTGHDLLSSLVSFIYTHDGATNAFPSSHVFLTLTSAYFLVLAYPSWAPLTEIFALLIVLSTFLIRQHYVLDIFGGALWTVAAIYASYLFIGF